MGQGKIHDLVFALRSFKEQLVLLFIDTMEGNGRAFFLDLLKKLEFNTAKPSTKFTSTILYRLVLMQNCNRTGEQKITGPLKCKRLANKQPSLCSCKTDL